MKSAITMILTCSKNSILASCRKLPCNLHCMTKPCILFSSRRIFPPSLLKIHLCIKFCLITFLDRYIFEVTRFFTWTILSNLLQLRLYIVRLSHQIAICQQNCNRWYVKLADRPTSYCKKCVHRKTMGDLWHYFFILNGLPNEKSPLNSESIYV